MTTIKTPKVTVSCAIFTVHKGDLKVLLTKRMTAPFKNQWSLASEDIDLNQDKILEDTAKRTLFETIGSKTSYLEQCITIGNNTRDPHGWTLTTVYFILHPYSQPLSDNAQWVSIKDIPKSLAFDYNHILDIALDRFRSKALYTSLPVYLMPETFTLSDLRSVYDLILGHNIEPKSFRRRMLGADFLQETAEITSGRGRPAQLYRLKEKTELYIFARNFESV